MAAVGVWAALMGAVWYGAKTQAAEPATQELAWQMGVLPDGFVPAGWPRGVTFTASFGPVSVPMIAVCLDSTDGRHYAFATVEGRLKQWLATDADPLVIEAEDQAWAACWPGVEYPYGTH